MANTSKESKYLLSLFAPSKPKNKEFLLGTSEELIKKKILEDKKFELSLKDLDIIIQKKELILSILEEMAKIHQEDTLYLSFILLQKLKIYKYYGEFTESQDVLKKINEIIKNDDNTKLKTKIIAYSLLKLNYVKDAEIILKEVEKDNFLEEANILINFINDNYKYQEIIDSLIKKYPFLSKRNELINNANVTLGISFNTLQTKLDSLCLLRPNDQLLTNIYKNLLFTNVGFQEGQYNYYFLLLYLYQNKKESTSLYLLKHMKEIKYSQYKQMKEDKNVLALYYCIKSILYDQSTNNEKSFKALYKFKQIEKNNSIEYKKDFSIDSFNYIETKIKSETNSLDEKLVKILSENKKREIINNIINPKEKDNKEIKDDLEFIDVAYPYFLSRNNRKEIINLKDDELIKKCKNDQSFLLSISAEEIINISKDYNRIKTSIKILNLKLENSKSDFEYGYIVLYLIQETAKLSQNKADIYELYNLLFKIPKTDENCTIFNCIFIN